jgi:hypothetical protein
MTNPIFGHSSGRGKWRLVALVSLAAILALLLAITSSASPGTIGAAAGFEDDDGNLAPASPINFDWNSFDQPTWTGTAPTRSGTATAGGWSFTGLEDYQATTGDSGFAGGTKQDDECASVITQKADNKADLKRVYFANKTVNGHVYLELAWVRIPQNTTSPSAHVAFEFNQSTTACGGSSNGLVHRSTANGGDMLIVYDFEGGSTDVPHIRLERWVGSGSCEIASHHPPCWGPATDLTDLSPPQAEAKVNTDAAVTDAILPSPPTSEQLGVSEFGEAGIDLTAAGVFAPGTCVGFGKAFGVSRTSGNSGTAQMKDLVGPGNVNIANCGAIKIHKTSTKGDAALAGAEFDIRKASDNSLVAHVTTDANGNSCTGALPLGSYTVTETKAPSGYKINTTSAQPVTVSTAGTCGSGNEATVSFDDTPLSKITVAFESLAAGDPTSATIQCTGDSSAQDLPEGTPRVLGDGTTTLVPGTYTCTVVVDP